ncbi:hypothetical protein GCM10023176_12930 [Micromonospora coerulea]|uniref:FXSXX-COOH protein n=1 Tax=Micromonospora coerulea TaxID=47856 RepID=A0ABP8SBS2_9ACTN
MTDAQQPAGPLGLVPLAGLSLPSSDEGAACAECLVGSLCELSFRELLALLDLADVAAVVGDALREIAQRPRALSPQSP